MNRAWVYLLTFGLSAATVGVLALLLALGWAATRCDTTDAGPASFLAECNAFGDYEHGALYYGLEGDAIDHLKRAEVHFLGNSQMQYAFATEQIDAFFQDFGARHYLLAFGHNEGSVFGEGLAKRHRLRPKALVINAVPYFSGDRGMPARRILGPRAPLTWVEYRLKALALELGARFCRRHEMYCAKESPTIYRARATGQWHVGGLLRPTVVPLRQGAGPMPQAYLEKAVVRGERFLRDLEVDPACVILTGIPAGTEFPGGVFAAALAERLGAKVLNVEVAEMMSIDGRHMTPETAMRWSAAFFSQLSPLLRACPALRRNPLDPPAGRP